MIKVRIIDRCEFCDGGAYIMEPDYLELARQQPVVSIKIAATLQVSKTDNNLFT
jgi:hypothetical protein